MIIGIDNGLDGGGVALSPLPGIPPIAKFVMPTRKVTYPARKSSKKRTVREVDTRGLIAILNELVTNRDETVVYFEHCPFHASDANAMRSMAISAGKILAVIEAKNLRAVRVLSIDWHPVILGKVPRGRSKIMAVDRAVELWPEENWSPSQRATLPHTGMVDAALIAEFGRLAEGGEPRDGLFATKPSDPETAAPVSKTRNP